MKEMYVSLSGAMTREKQLVAAANNLANVNTVGFKKQHTVFEVRPPDVRFDLMELSASPELDLPAPRQRLEGERNYVKVAETVTDFSIGDLRQTERGLDAAIERYGDGREGVAFFVVDTPEGLRYTRAGSFRVSSNEELVTPNGYVVQGQGGAISVTESITRPVSIGRDGTVFQDNEDRGRIRVAIVENPETLERVGEGLFKDSANGSTRARNGGPADGVEVWGGFLEMSNVNVVDELVRMIELQRIYTTHQKAIQTMDDASSRAVSAVLNA